jgi:Asp/Glu/hydantoin racemase
MLSVGGERVDGAIGGGSVKTKPTIALVHATLAPVEPMAAAFRARAPQAALMHFMDEGLLPLAEREGLTSRAIDAIAHLVARAEASGADGVLLTCSAYSPAVAELQKRVRVPVLSADEAMLRIAVERGRRIGIVATVAAAGPTTGRLLQDMARALGKKLETEVAVTPEAFAALKGGDGAKHDALVRAEVERLLPGVDAVILAQISMARAASGMRWAKPVLTSPEAAIDAILARLKEAAA